MKVKSIAAVTLAMMLCFAAMASEMQQQRDVKVEVRQEIRAPERADQQDVHVVRKVVVTTEDGDKEVDATN